MWLPRPITHRSPIATTVMPQRSWPGTVPALIVTSCPMMVSSPTSMPLSAKTEPGGNAMIEPRPNLAKARPAGVSAVTRPACWNSRHPQCTARQSASRLAVLTRHLSLIHHVTGPFCRAGSPGPTTRVAPGGHRAIPVLALGPIGPIEVCLGPPGPLPHWPWGPQGHYALPRGVTSAVGPWLGQREEGGAGATGGAD